MDDVYRLSDSDAAVSDEEETLEQLEKGQQRKRTTMSDSEDDMSSEDNTDMEDTMNNDIEDEEDEDEDMEMMDESTSNDGKRKKSNIVKGLTSEELEHYKKAQERSGLVYLSRIPPFMKPHKIRHLLSQYGHIGRIYLAPEDEHARKRRRRMGGNRKLMFTEGWVEFKDKGIAKQVAKSLNAQPIGGSGHKRGFYQHDLWNIKYLPKFKWNHLTERIAYERAARQQRMQTELEQARRENKLYLQNVERGQLLDTIRTRKQERKTKKSTSTSTNASVSRIDPNMERVHRTFRQKSVVKSEVDAEKQSMKKSKKQSSTASTTKVDSQVASVLAKLF